MTDDTLVRTRRSRADESSAAAGRRLVVAHQKIGVLVVLLGALASGTGGRVYDDAVKLVAELPDFSHSESVSALTGWWDTTWALAAVVALFALDWAIRRLNRLP